MLTYRLLDTCGDQILVWGWKVTKMLNFIFQLVFTSAELFFHVCWTRMLVYWLQLRGRRMVAESSQCFVSLRLKAMCSGHSQHTECFVYLSTAQCNATVLIVSHVKHCTFSGKCNVTATKCFVWFWPNTMPGDISPPLENGWSRFPIFYILCKYALTLFELAASWEEVVKSNELSKWQNFT